MTGRDILETLLAGIADSSDGALYVTEAELDGWPKGPVAALKAEGLLRRAAPARTVTCDGCERRCHMPAEVLDYNGEPVAFVFCDKRNDIDRVEVPIDRLTRWQSSGRAVADYLAAALQIRQPSGGTTHSKSWPVGMLRDKRAAHVELCGERILALKTAGHDVPLADVLTFRRKVLVMDRQRLVECVNNPVAGGGTSKSAAARGAEVTQVAIEKGVKAAAAHFGISPSRVKQVTAAHRKRIASGK